MLDTLYGAIYMRFLIRHDDLSEHYINNVCRMVLDGAATNGRSPQSKKPQILRNNGRKALTALRN